MAYSSACENYDASTWFICALLYRISWYSKFIPNCALFVKPFTALLHGNASMDLENTQNSIETVKQPIVSSPTCDPSLPAIVTRSFQLWPWCSP